jgi:Xaa-Pro aminopeptidase
VNQVSRASLRASERRSSDFPPIGYAGRPDAVRAALDGATLLVSNPSNIRWLTSFGGSLGWVVVGPSRCALITDGRYAERAAADLAAAGLGDLVDVVIGTTRPQVRDRVVAVAGDGPVHAEADHLTHAQWLDLAAELALEPDAGTITARRRVKDRGELARMDHAASIADAALADVAPMLAARPTEADVRDELEYRMHRAGADGPSYDTIVASGPENAARPHHHTGHRTIVEGDTVIIDVGALVDGYHSDMTRSFVVGEPTVEQAAIYELVLEAQLAGLDAVRAGSTARAVDAACRGMFADRGYGDWYLHGTGHGVGLDIHEDPFASQASTAELLVGDVVTVEPGLYRGGFGGFRIEDLVEVTVDGGRRLTHLSKDSPCLPSPPTT